jgi:hypothetical protein
MMVGGGGGSGLQSYYSINYGVSWTIVTGSGLYNRSSTCINDMTLITTSIDTSNNNLIKLNLFGVPIETVSQSSEKPSLSGMNRIVSDGGLRIAYMSSTTNTYYFSTDGGITFANGTLPYVVSTNYGLFFSMTATTLWLLHSDKTIYYTTDLVNWTLATQNSTAVYLNSMPRSFTVSSDNTNLYVLYANGTLYLQKVSNISTMTPAIMTYLNGITYNVQYQINALPTTKYVDSRFIPAMGGIASTCVGWGYNMSSLSYTGQYNVALGSYNLQNITSGSGNMGLGISGLQSLTTGTVNVGVGYSSFQAITTGTSNTGFGYQSGGNVTTSSSNNTFIGANTTASSSGIYNNSTALGYGATITGSNQIVIGTSGEMIISKGTLSVNGIYETAQATTGTTSPFTVNMALGSTFYIPTDYTFASNFQLILTNVPTDTSKAYTISIIYRQPTTLFYISTARVSDTATTYLLGTSSTYSAPYFNGGVPTLANTPNLIIQSFSIISTATSASTFSRYVITSVSNHY